MSRSLKKGPFIDFKLERKVLVMNESNKKSVVKTWARHDLSGLRRAHYRCTQR